MLVATRSRYVVDLNRDPSGASLYPGADITELVPDADVRERSDLLPGRSPRCRSRSRRARAEYFDPYHAALAAEIERVRARHGYAVLLDGHSIRCRSPAVLCRTSARSQSRDVRRQELRAGIAGVGRRGPRRSGRLYACRQRALQGRLRHAALRCAGARRPCAAARDCATMLHGRGAAMPLGCGTRRTPSRRAHASCHAAARVATGGGSVRETGEPRDPRVRRAKPTTEGCVSAQTGEPTRELSWRSGRAGDSRPRRRTKAGGRAPAQRIA